MVNYPAVVPPMVVPPPTVVEPPIVSPPIVLPIVVPAPTFECVDSIKIQYEASKNTHSSVGAITFVHRLVPESEYSAFKDKHNYVADDESVNQLMLSLTLLQIM